ncbi:MAG: ATP synthase F0 subunit B [Ignavibacteriae bacterium]|nr:ATP synthase F0 subunit B [Ignavibacteriota bacterium]|tara:strand:- start:760 stop:1299 length:540 start_codon:yes stop_codon:yes gene_type:complete
MTFLNYGLLALSGGEAGGPLDVNPGLIIWTVVTFVVLLLVLKKVAWKPILSSLDEREKFIKDSLEKAEVAQKEAEKLIQDNRESITKAEEEAQKIVAQGRDYAEKLKAQMLEESKAEAKKMIDNAKAEIERKNQEAFNNIKDQVAEIAVNAAEKIIKENLDKEKNTQLVNKLIDELQKN